MVEPVYCEDNGKSAVDWVVLFKLVLLQCLYNLPSLRRTAEEAEMNVAHRWFLGYAMSEKTPRFKAVAYDFQHRFTPENIEKIYTWVLDETNKAGYYKIPAAFAGTPGDKNVHYTTRKKEQIATAAKHYTKQLLEEMNRGR
jgi:hypothetical protein